MGFLVSGVVYADYPASPTPTSEFCNSVTCSGSPQSVCDASNSGLPAGSFVATRITDDRYSCKHKDTGYISTYADRRLNYCPHGGTYNATTNTCVGADAPPPPPPPGCPTIGGGSGRWAIPPAPMPGPAETGGCVSGCRVQMTGVQGCYGPTGSLADQAAGTASCVFDYLHTGSQCTPGADAPGTASDPGSVPRMDQVPPMKPPPGTSKCPSGTVQGGMDSAGTPICIGTGTTPKNAPPPPPKAESEKTETMPDGGTKTTKTETVTNADGSTTTNTTVTITKPDGSKSTSGGTVTSSTPSGAAGKADTPQKDDNNLCKQNPMLAICRNSSVAGSCGQITCEGDAIQCATLRAAAAMQCKQQADEDALKASPLTGKGQAAIDGADLADMPTPGKASVVDIGTVGQNADGWLGGGSAFEDFSFNAMGHTIVVPFAKVTGYLVALRYALMIMAALVSFRILSGAILRE